MKKRKKRNKEEDTIVLSFAQKEAEAMKDWAKRSLESSKYLGASEPRF